MGPIANWCQWRPVANWYQLFHLPYTPNRATGFNREFSIGIQLDFRFNRDQLAIGFYWDKLPIGFNGDQLTIGFNGDQLFHFPYTPNWATGFNWEFSIGIQLDFRPGYLFDDRWGDRTSHLG